MGIRWNLQCSSTLAADLVDLDLNYLSVVFTWKQSGARVDWPWPLIPTSQVWGDHVGWVRIPKFKWWWLLGLSVTGRPWSACSLIQQHKLMYLLKLREFDLSCTFALLTERKKWIGSYLTNLMWVAPYSTWSFWLQRRFYRKLRRNEANQRRD